MKSKYTIGGLALIILVGIVVAIYSFFPCIDTDLYGTAADWVAAIGGTVAVVMAILELKNSRETFFKEHSPNLDVYLSWQWQINEYTIDFKDNHDEDNHSNVKSEDVLHVMPVNKGLASGTFRFFGICKTEDLKKVKGYLIKAQRKEITDEEIIDLARKVYTNSLSGADLSNNDLQGKSILYPVKSCAFKSIKGNDIGETFDAKLTAIEKKLGQIRSKELIAIYVDPSMKTYCFTIGTFDNNSKEI